MECPGNLAGIKNLQGIFIYRNLNISITCEDSPSSLEGDLLKEISVYKNGSAAPFISCKCGNLCIMNFKVRAVNDWLIYTFQDGF